jgi:phosphoribosylamine--glycine ligase/phosphoribosylformylglycinamidine cyclo-ligase
MSSRA